MRLLFTLIFSQLYNVLQPLMLPYNCINTVLVKACTENGLVYSEWYIIFNISHLQKETIIKPIGLNVHKTPPPCSYVTLCMLFTVQYINSLVLHTHETLITQTIHWNNVIISPLTQSLVLKKEIPTYFWGMSQEPGIYFYLALQINRETTSTISEVSDDVRDIR